MPRYSSCDVLRNKLKYAIHFCKSIDTDDYARIALTGDPIGDNSDADLSSSNDSQISEESWAAIDLTLS